MTRLTLKCPRPTAARDPGPSPPDHFWCPECEGWLDVSQPDLKRPDRLLGVCLVTRRLYRGLRRRGVWVWNRLPGW